MLGLPPKPAVCVLSICSVDAVTCHYNNTMDVSKGAFILKFTAL